MSFLPCASADISDKFFFNLALGALIICDKVNLSTVTKKFIKI